jgi:hypothetical protein
MDSIEKNSLAPLSIGFFPKPRELLLIKLWEYTPFQKQKVSLE